MATLTRRDRANERTLREYSDRLVWAAGEPDPVAALYSDPSDRDYDLGCYPSEHAAAYDLSRREFDNGMRAINALTAQGLHVVAVAAPAYCRFTDASLGTCWHVESAHLSRRVADRVAFLLAMKWQDDPECGIEVFPRLPRPEPVTPVHPYSAWSWINDPCDDIPF